MMLPIESIVLKSDTEYMIDTLCINVNNIVFIANSNVQRTLVEKHLYNCLETIKKANPNVSISFIKMIDNTVIFASEDYLVLMLRINKFGK